MNGLLHPVGPEPVRTYWLRRALVLGLLALVLAVLIGLVVHGTGGGGRVTAAPAVTPLPSDGGTSSPSPSATPTGTLTPAGSSSRTPSASAHPSSASPSSRPAAALPSCSPARLRTTLTGDQTLAPGQPNVFHLSLANTGATTCRVRVTAKTLTLTISSGLDRIWSSADCPQLVKPQSARLVSHQAVHWRVRWDGRRSAPGCRPRSGVPQAGTYVVTAQLRDARPVRLRMILRG